MYLHTNQILGVKALLVDVVHYIGKPKMIFNPCMIMVIHTQRKLVCRVSLMNQLKHQWGPKFTIVGGKRNVRNTLKLLL